jgi:aryl-alcohol dehydrogenase-like predicted oxidoreductase
MIPTAPFGRTGHESSRVIFGAAGLASMRQDRADEVLDRLLRHGVNHIDTAADYGDSELCIAPWMPAHRRDVFLATKTGQRTGDAARAELERSLERLGVDHVDLIQLHNLVEPDEWEVAHGHGGAVAALAQARDEGLARHIGVTGHGTRIARMHLRSLAEFPFDSVLLPYSYVALTDPAYRADVDELLAVCAADQVAVQTIKGVSRRRWRDDDERRRFAWYEPLTDDEALARAVRWVLGDPQVFLTTTSDASVMARVLDIAEEAAGSGAGGGYVRPSDAEMQADVDTLAMEPLFDGGAVERI